MSTPDKPLNYRAQHYPIPSRKYAPVIVKQYRRYKQWKPATIWIAALHNISTEQAQAVENCLAQARAQCDVWNMECE